MFQFTHPRGVRQWAVVQQEFDFEFQFTHPRGVRHVIPLEGVSRRCFNSRTHEGCDRNTLYINDSNARFQFTHPRGVRPVERVEKRKRCYVSIHAPTRGATVLPCRVQLVWLVSIHAPTRGATYLPLRIVSYYPSFNSRTHEGCDTTTQRHWACHPLFQFTHPRGVRQKCIGSLYLNARFQFTHPRGVRLECREYSSERHKVSIHAPTRGATLCQVHITVQESVSIHAPTRGATFAPSLLYHIIQFQFTHPRGVRPNFAPSIEPST